MSRGSDELVYRSLLGVCNAVCVKERAALTFRAPLFFKALVQLISLYFSICRLITKIPLPCAGVPVTHAPFPVRYVIYIFSVILQGGVTHPLASYCRRMRFSSCS